MKLAIIKDGVVTNIVTVPDDRQNKWTPPDGTTVVEDAMARIGWLYDGVTFTPDESVVIVQTRNALQNTFKVEGVKRISTRVPAWDSLETVQLVVSIANMLNAGAMTTTQNNARLTYLYVRDTALPKLNTLTLAELEQVDPTAAQPFLAVDNTDDGWPV